MMMSLHPVHFEPPGGMIAFLKAAPHRRSRTEHLQELGFQMPTLEKW
jgi:hypothetical protein